MKKILLTIILSGFFTAFIYACEPCSRKLGLMETMSKADLVIVGEKTLEDKEIESGQPEWIEVRILKTLKGNIAQDKIRVNSWDGMCPYGIVVDDRPYLMFLVKKYIPNAEYQYDTVDYGCGVKSFVVETDMVNIEGKPMSLDSFQELLQAATINR